MKLLQEKSKKKALWKYAFATPLFLGMLFFSIACQEATKEEAVRADSELNNELLDVEVVGNKTIEEDKIAKSEILSVVDEQPEFKGGVSEMYKFIANEIRYPAEALQNGIEGRVFVKFVVDKEGKPRDFEILKSLGYGLEAEAIRVLKLMPNWNPGKQNGEKVNVYFTMPIFFKLD
jgi:TonB family protein